MKNFEQLILVRHGETTDNVLGVAQGWGNSELSERGQEQVRKLALRLRSFGATSIFSSPLSRAMATARAIGDVLGLEITTLDDLREMNYGEWERQKFLEVRRNYPDQYRQWVDDPDAPSPGGESHSDVLTRMMRAIRSIADSANGQSLRPIVVSHGTAIRIAATGILGLPPLAARSFAQDNAAINNFIWRGERFVLKLWNDTTHCMEGKE